MNTTLAPAWAGLEIRRCPALRRTHLVVYGSVDGELVDEVRSAVAGALSEGHTLTFDLHHLTRAERSPLGALLELAEESVQA